MGTKKTKMPMLYRWVGVACIILAIVCALFWRNYAATTSKTQAAYEAEQAQRYSLPERTLPTETTYVEPRYGPSVPSGWFPQPTDVPTPLPTTKVLTDIPSSSPETSAPSIETTVKDKTVKPKPAPLIQSVPAAPPVSFSIHEPGITVNAQVEGMPFPEKGMAIEPKSCSTHLEDVNCPKTAYWIEDKLGTAPGSNVNNSTVITGHAWSQQKRVFNALSERAMSGIDASTVETEAGCGGTCEVNVYPSSPELWKNFEIKLETSENGKKVGELWYQVDRVIAVDKTIMNGNGSQKVWPDGTLKTKPDISSLDSPWAVDPNVLKLLVCAVDGETDTDRDYTIVIFAKLVKAQPAEQ